MYGTFLFPPAFSVTNGCPKRPVTLNLERRVGVMAVYKNTAVNVYKRNTILPLSWLAGVLYIEWFVPTEFTEDLYAYGIHQCT